MGTKELITEFLEFQSKHYKHLFVEKQGDVWFLKRRKKDWKMAPAIIKVSLTASFIIDDYSIKESFDDFKEFKNRFVIILKEKIDKLQSLKI